MQKVFYVPGQTAIIDYARQIGPNAWAACATWLMLPEIQGDEVGFLQAQEAAHGTQPARITETRYDFALSRAQVLDYNAGEAGDSFILQAPEVGDLVRVYARSSGRYWTFLALPTITHCEIWQRIHQQGAAAD